MHDRLPRWAELVLLPLLNLCLALGVSALIVAYIGYNPLEALRVMLHGAFGYGEGVGYTLHFATNFVFAGLAFAVASQAGLFSIGAEGQAYVAGLGVVAAAALFGHVHWLIVFGSSVVFCGVVGGLWGFVPGYLQSRRGSHIVITTIMFNFLAAALMVYLLNRVLKPAGEMAPESAMVPEAGRLPPLRDYFEFLGYSPLNPTVFVALLALVFVYVLVWHTSFGLAMRTHGLNPDAARYAGISSPRIVMIAMTISGALAGMIAVNEVLGVQNRVVINFVSGYGFVGIAVGLMGRNHPLGIALAALLFGALYQGGQELAFAMPGISLDMIVVIQSLVILFTGAMEKLLLRPVQIAFELTGMGSAAGTSKGWWWSK